METIFDPKFYLVGLAVCSWASLLAFWPRKEWTATIWPHAGLVIVVGWIIGLEPSHPVVFALGSWLMQVACYFLYSAMSIGRRTHGRGEVHPKIWLVGIAFLLVAVGFQTLHLVGVESPEDLTGGALDRLLPYWILLCVFHGLGARVFALGMVQAMASQQPPEGGSIIRADESGP